VSGIHTVKLICRPSNTKSTNVLGLAPPPTLSTLSLVTWNILYIHIHPYTGQPIQGIILIDLSPVQSYTCSSVINNIPPRINLVTQTTATSTWNDTSQNCAKYYSSKYVALLQVFLVKHQRTCLFLFIYIFFLDLLTLQWLQWWSVFSIFIFEVVYFWSCLFLKLFIFEVVYFWTSLSWPIEVLRS